MVTSADATNGLHVFSDVDKLPPWDHGREEWFEEFGNLKERRLTPNISVMLGGQDYAVLVERAPSTIEERNTAVARMLFDPIPETWGRKLGWWPAE